MLIDRNGDVLPDPGAQRTLLLSGDADPWEQQDEIAGSACVAIRFDGFADGRGYSLATIIRQQLGYAGDLRALGVYRDLLKELAGCGFSSFDVQDL